MKCPLQTYSKTCTRFYSVLAYIDRIGPPIFAMTKLPT